MFAWPGVWMKITISPGVGTRDLIRSPSCSPDVYSAWPMYAIPAAFAATAASICAAIWDAIELVEPVHFGAGMPSSLAQSARPYWVGTKKGLVVTWLTNQNCHEGVLGKAPEPLSPLAALLDELQAVSSADAAAVALTSPAPARSRRRVGLSLRLSVSIASSTLGSTFLAMRTSSVGGS